MRSALWHERMYGAFTVVSEANRENPHELGQEFWQMYEKLRTEIAQLEDDDTSPSLTAEAREARRILSLMEEAAIEKRNDPVYDERFFNELAKARTRLNLAERDVSIAREIVQ